MQRPATVDAYVASAPVAQRPQLAALRAMIRKHLPRAEESMGPNGFAVYADGDARWVAGFAWRKKGPVLYVMNAGVVDRYADRLGSVRSGRSCVEWRATKTLTIEELTKLAGDILRDAAAAHRAGTSR